MPPSLGNFNFVVKFGFFSCPYFIIEQQLFSFLLPIMSVTNWVWYFFYGSFNSTSYYFVIEPGMGMNSQQVSIHCHRNWLAFIKLLIISLENLIGRQKNKSISMICDAQFLISSWNFNWFNFFKPIPTNFRMIKQVALLGENEIKIMYLINMGLWGSQCKDELTYQGLAAKVP